LPDCLDDINVSPFTKPDSEPKGNFRGPRTDQGLHLCAAAYEPNNELNHKVRLKSLFALQPDLVVEFQNGIDSAAFLEKFEHYTTTGFEY